MLTRAGLLTLVAINAFAQCRVPVWSDEFDGTAIDSGKWSFQTGGGGWGNQELENYTDRPANATVRDGKLIITALREDLQGSRYTSARMRTIQKGDWRYGRFEALMKLPVSQGMWPAFWMMPTDAVYGGWPMSGEIDIMELIGKFPSRVYGTLHTVDPRNQHVSFGKQIDLTAGTLADGFHLFTAEWDPDEIRIYLDDQIFVTQKKPLPNGAAWPFDQRFHFIVNLAVGGVWPGSPDASTAFPQTLEVEYVRVSQKPEDLQIAGPSLVEPGTMQASYRLPAIAGAAYQWSVPDGASIDGAADSNTVSVNWGDASGALSAHLSTSCGDSDIQLPVTVSSNLWLNGAFDAGFANWSTRVAGPGQAVFSNAGDAPDGFSKSARIDVSHVGVNPWDIQLTRPNVPLAQGQAYRMTFWAKSSAGPRTIPVSFIDAADFSGYTSRSFDFDDTWRQFVYEFQSPVSASAIMNFDLARETGSYLLTGFTFERIP